MIPSTVVIIPQLKGQLSNLSREKDISLEHVLQLVLMAPSESDQCLIRSNDIGKGAKACTEISRGNSELVRQDNVIC